MPPVLHRSPAVNMAGEAAAHLGGTISEVPKIGYIRAKVEPALKGHVGIYQGRGRGHEPIGRDSLLYPDEVGLRDHAADPADSLDHHVVPEDGVQGKMRTRGCQESPQRFSRHTELGA